LLFFRKFKNISHIWTLLIDISFEYFASLLLLNKLINCGIRIVRKITVIQKFVFVSCRTFKLKLKEESEGSYLWDWKFLQHYWWMFMSSEMLIFTVWPSVSSQKTWIFKDYFIPVNFVSFLITLLNSSILKI
jgi:hypothetical protein